MGAVKFSRVWAMPSADTFSIPPIRELVRWQLRECRVIVDPFARNSHFGTITNDLSPETEASSHLDATEFLAGLVSEGVQADAVLFDPPYSPRQIMECYQGIGRQMMQTDAHHSKAWSVQKKLIDQMVKVGGIVICCGWNSQGMGKVNQYDLEELLLVPHGSGHNDTIVTVERKVQMGFFAVEARRDG